MPSKRRGVANKRLANRTISNLEDILAACLKTQRLMNEAMTVAEKKMDVQMLMLLTRIDRELTFVQRKAQNARDGKYYDE